MNASRTHARKRLSSVMRLVRKIEQTASPSPKAGSIRNQFGTYDDARTTEKLLAEFEDLVAEFPEEEYFTYLFAASLARARRFERAIQLYKSLVAGDGQYGVSAAMMLPVVFWCAGDRVSAQEALDAYNAPLIAKGIAPQHERVEQLFAPGAAL
jgi:tetratricopeptide (TPR) repeat protein